MKIIITGHTKGLGKSIHDHYANKNFQVIGLSRSNGFDLEKDLFKIIELVNKEKCDYFFNNAYCQSIQGTLIENLWKCTSIITSGSIGADYSHTGNQYYQNKSIIEETHKKFKKISSYPMLLLKMGYLENYTDKTSIKYQDILNCIDFWLSTPRLSLIELDNIHYDNNFKDKL